ncbi:hypothetical protein EXT46_16140 [Pseudoalteromonas sp. CO325X]|uniref:hypothetical protein n=1 Tax=Pseudoalteromonas sp. CO325X TaxID=1777262 RepID=UPI001022A862|nr:hypothetical protein [Pseudoalteromonas sp. CO325X]RZF77658.1 hypothetical protein EXT46_16140 [Pseudoalteromonas sp. CO325X]
MDKDLSNYLLIDSDPLLSRAFCANPDAHAVIVAGANTRHMVKLMFDQQVKDYCYCDFDNEISVAELSSYVSRHHSVAGVLVFACAYESASNSFKWVIDSLHENRLLINKQGADYHLTPLTTPYHQNHLSCNQDPDILAHLGD